MKLTLETLETWLWDSVDIIRGVIDSSDFKNYIFRLHLTVVKYYRYIQNEKELSLMR